MSVNPSYKSSNHCDKASLEETTGLKRTLVTSSAILLIWMCLCAAVITFSFAPVLGAIRDERTGSFVFLCAIIFYMVSSMCLLALAKYIVYCMSSIRKKERR